MRRTSRIALACLVLFLASPPTTVHSWTKTQTVPDTKREKRKGNWRPEVVILGHDKKSVSEALVSHMTAAGYSVAQASDFLLGFEKPANTLVQLLAGVGAVMHVSYNLIAMDGTVRVVADIAAVSRNTFGREQRTDMNSGNTREQVQTFLDNLAASMPPAVAPPPAGTIAEDTPPKASAGAPSEAPRPVKFDEDTTERVVFGGLRFGDHPDAVKAKLETFSPVDTSETVHTFTGTVAGEANGEVVGVFTPETKRLCRVILKLKANEESYASIKSKWEDVVSSLTTKYGKPTRLFSSPDSKSNALEVNAIRLGRCKMVADWDLGNMTILCDVQTDLRIWIAYASPAYTAVERSEKAAKRASEF
jgi:hypothetical protein